jgi:hypothetical protein
VDLITPPYRQSFIGLLIKARLVLPRRGSTRSIVPPPPYFKSLSKHHQRYENAPHLEIFQLDSKIPWQDRDISSA